jgi:hypothetical protein
MHLYEIAERVKYGIPIVRDGEPRLQRPVGCPQDIRLHPKLIAVIEDTDPAVELRLERASPDFAPHNLLLLKSPAHGHRDRQVLVHVITAGGVGGKAYLTANVLEEQMDRGWVRRRPRSFPPIGVQPFCTDEELARIREGVDILDVMLLMNPGANFCIRRTGNLEGAQPVLPVRWNGAWLSIDGQNEEIERRRQPARAAVGALAFANN